jgi:hypothetical protein
VGSVITGWVLTRATDYDQTGTGTGEIAPGDTTFILSGTVNASTQWVQTTDLPITIGTTPITFVQIAGPGAYTAGTGLTLTGTQFSLTSPVTVSLGGTGVTTLTGLAYGNGTGAFTAATAAQVVATISTTAVTNSTNATNATNLALTAGSGATNYITYAAATTGNQPQYTTTSLTYNATNGTITGGINGGTF